MRCAGAAPVTVTALEPPVPLTRALLVDLDDPPAWLYRLYDAAGALLYIGRTRNLLDRVEQHARQHAWGAEIASVTAQLYASEAEVKRAEPAAIAAENPRHNRVRPRARVAAGGPR
jgi:excinuclease ABC subunit C